MFQRSNLAVVMQERQSAQMALDMQRQQMIASAKMAALGQMSAGLAHEINTPLAVISGMLIGLEDVYVSS